MFLVADAIISWNWKKKRPIGNLRLQKFMYLVQGMSLAVRDGTPAFEGRILAGQGGPVVREVYDLGKFARGGNFRELFEINHPSEMDGELTAIINGTMERYAHLSDPALLQLLYDVIRYPEGRAWALARLRYRGYAVFEGPVIPNEDIRVSFQALLGD